MRSVTQLAWVAAWVVSTSAPAWAQGASGGGAAPAEVGAADLAKQLSNPVASLISVPFQGNWEFGVGPDEQTRFVVNFQPVVPIPLNENWNLIARVIVPTISQPPLVPGGAAEFGVSDILASGFFSPTKPGRLIWGVGPVLLLPTTSDPFLGTERWGIGPTAVFLKQMGPWTAGGLVNHVWSFAGNDARADVNQTFLQPFLAYATASGVTWSLNSETTANWEASSGQEWTVPINLVVSKVMKIGRRPTSLGIGGGYFAEQPDGGPEWKLRTVVTLLYPR